jgi:hypothetical protein
MDCLYLARHGWTLWSPDGTLVPSGTYARVPSQCGDIGWTCFLKRYILTIHYIIDNIVIEIPM